MTSYIISLIEDYPSITAVIVSLVFVPILAKRISYFEGYNLRDLVDDVESHAALVERYRRDGSGWYEKGIRATLSLFERVYGVRTFSSQSFARSMQIATVYFWIACLIALLLTFLFFIPSGVFIILDVVQAKYIPALFLIVFSAWVSVKAFFLSRLFLDCFVKFSGDLLGRVLSKMSEVFTERHVWFPFVTRKFLRIFGAFLIWVLYFVFVRFLFFWIIRDAKPEPLPSPEGVLFLVLVLILLFLFCALTLRLVVEAGIWYPVLAFAMASAAFVFGWFDHVGLFFIVFSFTIFPTCNAFFDFISVGETRRFLTRIIQEGSGLRAIFRNLFLDFLVALSSFLGLILSSLFLMNILSVFWIGLVMEGGVSVSSMRGFDFLGVSQYVLVEELPASPEGVSNTVEARNPDPQSISDGAKEPESELISLLIFAMVFGFTTYAPSLLHFLIVCANLCSRKTMSWHRAVCALENAPSPISKDWVNTVVRDIRAGYSWGWGSLFVILIALVTAFSFVWL